MNYSGFALVVEPDRPAAAELAGLLFSEGIECAVASSDDQAWDILATRSPGLILVALNAPPALRFERRLRDEYCGARPPLVGLGHGRLAPRVAQLDLDAVVLRPLYSGSLLAALLAAGPESVATSFVPSLTGAPSAQPIPTVSIGAEGSCEMSTLTLLGKDLEDELDGLARRLARIYGLSGCAVLIAGKGRYWVGTAGERIARQAWPTVWSACAQAVHAGAPLFVEMRDGNVHTAPTLAPIDPARRPSRFETRLAVPIRSQSGAVIGAIYLVRDRPVLFATRAREALFDLAERIAAELAVRRVERPATAGHDTLREAATLGPGGRYRIAREISRGAMGVVCEAEDAELGRSVAIKMLHPDLVRDPELVRRFRAEAVLLASIHHDNLVRVHSFVEERDDVFFVMELVEGVSLDRIIAELAEADAYLPLDRAAAILGQMASALDAMHAAGVTHRDVKPGNVVLDRTRERAVLVDVGLAHRLGDEPEPAGTPGFIAPESLLGRVEGPATDVYGLAATAYALLTGHAPFGRAEDYREILRRQLEDAPHPPSEWREDLSPAVDVVILRGLAVDSGERYASAGEMARALAFALGQSDDEFTAVPAPRGRPTELDRAMLDRAMLDGPTRPPGDTFLDIGLDPHPATSPDGEPAAMTRGAVFRGVTGLLGQPAANAWMRSLERENRPLADALSLRTSPMAWLPAERFHDLLAAVSANGHSAPIFARGLGVYVAAQSFQRFYSSNPESLSPDATLRALNLLWRRFHTWGRLRAMESDEQSAAADYDGPSDPAVCAFIEGWLEQVLTLSGGDGARVVHTHCVAQGDDVCHFAARWRNLL